MALLLDRSSTPPGGPAQANGHGCDANSPVTLSIGSMTVATTTAAGDGSFSTLLHLNVPVGRFTIVAVCGPTLTATIDVVLTSQAGPPTTTVAILLILLLAMVLALVSRRGRRPTGP